MSVHIAVKYSFMSHASLKYKSSLDCCTLQIPRLNFVQIHIFYNIQVYLLQCYLFPKVVINEFLIGRVETKAGRNMCESVHLLLLRAKLLYMQLVDVEQTSLHHG